MSLLFSRTTWLRLRGTDLVPLTACVAEGEGLGIPQYVRTLTDYQQAIADMTMPYPEMWAGGGPSMHGPADVSQPLAAGAPFTGQRWRRMAVVAAALVVVAAALVVVAAGVAIAVRRRRRAAIESAASDR